MSEFDYLKIYNIQHKIDSFSKKYKEKKIVIYGAGKFSDYIFNNYNLSKLNIIAVADIKFEKEENPVFYGYKGIKPKEIKNINPDCVIIFNLKANDIINYIDDSIFENKTKIPIEWVLKQTPLDYLKRKIRYGKPRKNSNKKYIFTFWEPKSKIPAYVNLCMKSWYKFLPEYEIVVLDYTNIDEWLGFDFFDDYLYKNFSLAKQADAIRAAVLYKHGGAWFDADTIVTSEKIKGLLNQNADVTMFNTHIGFIVAKKGAKVLKLWLQGIKRNIFLHKLYKFSNKFIKNIFESRFTAKMDNWNYLGNLIIDKIRKNTDNKNFLSLQRTDYYALPENNFFSDEALSSYDKYIEFYFKNDCLEYVYENEKGIICLHNSWTPNQYKNMSEEEFLNQNITLAKILKNI